MQTDALKRTHPNRKRMQVARGGKRGKTSGRGGKGQTARAGNKRRPEWRDIIKRLPKLRGRGKNSNKSIKTDSRKPAIVSLAALEIAFSSGEAVTPIILVEKGVVPTFSGRVSRIKILGGGELTKSLKVSGCGVSESAKAAIEKAGGSIVPLAPAFQKEVKVRQAPKAEAKSPAVPAKAVKAKAEARTGAKTEKAKPQAKTETAKKPAKPTEPKNDK
jgi:large subunit ribosomal protein L15